MKKSKCLFGDSIDKTVIEVQKSIARYKINKASGLTTRLLKINAYTRDDERINDVLKAQKFWQNILEEEI